MGRVGGGTETGPHPYRFNAQSLDSFIKNRFHSEAIDERLVAGGREQLYHVNVGYELESFQANRKKVSE